MGFFALDRELLSHEIWLEEPFTKGQAWVDLIGLANHDECKMYIRNKSIECQRGEVNRSFRWLGRRWKWSTDKVIRFIKFLEAEQMVRHETRQGETVITLCNYSLWQDKYRHNKTPNETDVETQTRQQHDTNETPTRHEQQYKQNKQGDNISNPNLNKDKRSGEGHSFSLSSEMRDKLGLK